MTSLLLNDATLIDGTGADPRPHVSVLAEEGRITRIAGAGEIAAPDGARTIDCGGMTLMPGLTDAHVHFGLTATRRQRAAREPRELRAEGRREHPHRAGRGVHDGARRRRPRSRVRAGRRARARSPGRGSCRRARSCRRRAGTATTAAAGATSPCRRSRGWSRTRRSVDGPDEVRRAARTQIRRGATQVKLMASGGVMSPNDPLESLQFTVDEMAAAVHEARAFGTYVLAHCHTPGAIANALDAGVRSIEHGSILNETLAKRMARQDAYLVPTLVILELLSRIDGDAGVQPTQDGAGARRDARAASRLARAAGVRIGSGSDLLGPRQRRRAAELVEKAKQFGPMEAIVSATTHERAAVQHGGPHRHARDGQGCGPDPRRRRSAGGYRRARRCAERAAGGAARALVVKDALG